jgi:hypothetical protein
MSQICRTISMRQTAGISVGVALMDRGIFETILVMDAGHGGRGHGRSLSRLTRSDLIDRGWDWP